MPAASLPGVDHAAELAGEQRSLGADLLNNVNQPGLYFTLIRGSTTLSRNIWAMACSLISVPGCH
jgi:hypothetical protein